MINELKRLSESMEKCGIQAQDWHKKFNGLKTSSPCYIIHLAEDGSIADIRFLEKEQVKYLRTYQGGSNGETFPAFNFTPFYKFSENIQKKLTEKKRKEICDILIGKLKNHEEPDDPDIERIPRDKADKKTSKCLGKIADDFFDLQLKNASFPVLSKLKSALHKLLDSENNPASLADRFNEKLLDFLISSPDLGNYSSPDNSLYSILFMKNKAADVILFFDIEFPASELVADSKTMKEINCRLLSISGEGKQSNSQCGKDAFGEVFACDDLKDKMPAVKLPKFSKSTILRNMSKEYPCQKRYNSIESESYPVCQKIRSVLKKSLEWICNPENIGKTWENVGEGEILFAYPLDLIQPSGHLFLAQVLGSGKNNERRFLDCAHDVLRQLVGLNCTLKNIEIELFAIKQADEGRHKVVYNRNYSADLLESSVGQWQTGAENLPEIRLRSWISDGKAKSDKKWNELIFAAPYPLAVMPLVYTKWHQNGQAKTVPQCSKLDCGNIPRFDGLELFFSSIGGSDFIEVQLSKLLDNGMPLLIAAGKSAHGGEIISSGSIAEYLKKALPLMGILLYKLNIRKEIYMNESPYLIGKMLNLTDRLHALYCKDVRKGNQPHELLGGAFYSQTAANPVQSFAVLGERLRPYLAWAKTSSGENSALAHWLLTEIGKTADAIKEHGLPERLSDSDKAQMILGYLGSISSDDTRKIQAEESTNE